MDDSGPQPPGDEEGTGHYAFETSFQIGEIAKALATAQGQMKAAEFDRENPGFHFRYATIASIWDAIRGPLSANGLAVTQLVSNGDLVTMLIHASGQWFRSVSKILAKDQSAQGWGSGLTYSRRYCLQAIVGAASADEDDDGEEASKPKAPISPKKESPKPATDRHPETDHICPEHKVPFRLFDKDGRKWYSHKAGEGWCNEQALKAQEPQPGEPGGTATGVEPGQAVLDEAFPPEDGAPPESGTKLEKPTGPTMVNEDDFLNLSQQERSNELLKFQKVDRDRFGRIKVKLGLTNKTLSELTPQEALNLSKALMVSGG